MNKWKYIIVDTFDGMVRGTNDRAKAEEFSEAEEYFVIDVENQRWITFGAEGPVPIPEQK